MTGEELKQFEALRQENAHLKYRLQKVIEHLQHTVVERERLPVALKNRSKSDAE